MEARQRPSSAGLAEQTRRAAVRSRATTPPADNRRKSRRRKRDGVMRRHTLTGAEGKASAEQGLRPGGKERLAKERERFLDLLRSRYPEQAEAIASELEWGGDTATKQHRQAGSVFLQFNGETKRVSLPVQLTLSGAKQLFVSAFSPAIDSSLMDPPHGAMYIYEPSSALYYELTDVGDVRDNSVLAFHRLNPRASFSPPLSPATDSTGQTLLQLNQQLPENSGQQLDSTFSLDKLHSMQEQLSKLTGLVQQAVLKGQSLGDLVNADYTAEGILTHTGRLADAVSASSIASFTVVPETDFPDGRPPKPSRLPVLHVYESKQGTAAVQLPQSKEGCLSRWRIGSGPAAPLTVEEKHLIVRSADGVRRNIQLMRREVKAVRKQHTEQCEAFAKFMKEAADRIAKAINIQQPRKIIVSGDERKQMIEEEFVFQKHSDTVVQDIQCLDKAVEEIRIDVVNRRCRVDNLELEDLSKTLQVSARSLLELRKRFVQLSERLKPVMASELQTIVGEEKMLEEHTPALEAAVANCKKMHGTLAALKRYGAVQQHRAKFVPVIIPSFVNPDRREVLDNIDAMAPNHLARREAIEAAAAAYERRRQLKQDHQAETTKQLLEASHSRLKHVGRVLQEVESRRLDMIRHWYLEDKQYDSRHRPRAATWSQQPLTKQRHHQDRRYPREAVTPHADRSRDGRYVEWRGGRGSDYGSDRSYSKVQRYPGDNRDRGQYGYQNGHAHREEVDHFRQPYPVDERATRPVQQGRTHSDRQPRGDEWQTGDSRRGASDMRDVISHSYSRAGPSVTYDQSRSASNSSGSVTSPKQHLSMPPPSPRNNHMSLSNPRNVNQSTPQRRKYQQPQSSRYDRPLPPSPVDDDGLGNRRIHTPGDSQYTRDGRDGRLKPASGAHRGRNVRNGDLDLDFVTSDL